jgi:hypothetical protein
MRIKERIAKNIGPYLTCSVGFAANRQLAKMACKAGKRPDESSYGDGCAIWFLRDMPEPLLRLKLADIPGVGSRMENKLFRARIRRASCLFVFPMRRHAASILWPQTRPCAGALPLARRPRVHQQVMNPKTKTRGGQHDDDQDTDQGRPAPIHGKRNVVEACACARHRFYGWSQACRRCRRRLLASDRDRGTPRSAAPPTPPGIRVRTMAVRSNYAPAVT